MDTTHDRDSSTLMIIAGVTAAVVVAGIAGRLLYNAAHPAKTAAMEVENIIGRCQETISKMDQTLSALKQKAAAAAQ